MLIIPLELNITSPRSYLVFILQIELHADELLEETDGEAAGTQQVTSVRRLPDRTTSR